MSPMASQITSRTIVYASVYSDADQRKHQSSMSLAFVRGIHWWPVNSRHKGPVTRKMLPFERHHGKPLPYASIPTCGLILHFALHKYFRITLCCVVQWIKLCCALYFYPMCEVDFSWRFVTCLTHWGRDKMAAVSPTTLSNAFSWMKMLEFRLRFH